MNPIPRIVQWHIPTVAPTKPSLEALLAEAQAHRSRGDVKSAHATLVRAVRDCPPDPRPYRELGRLAESLQRLEDALACHDRALAIEPRDVETLLAKADVLVRLARWDEVRQVAMTVLTIEPDHPDARVLLAGLAQLSGNLAEAEQQVRAALTAHPTHAGATNMLGKVLLAQGDRGGALAMFERATEANPAHVEAWVNLGAMQLTERGDRQKAIACYRCALEINPNCPEAHLNLGTALFDEKSVKEAAGHLQHAIALRPIYPEAYVNLAVGLIGAMYFENALQACDRGLQVCGDHPGLWAQKAEALALMGRHQAAIEAGRRAIDFGYSANNLKVQMASWYRNLCDWREGGDRAAWRAWVDSGTTVNPFVLLSIDDDPLLQKRAAAQSVQNGKWSKASLPFVRKGECVSKLRIGYLSPDFRNHPIMTILGDVFEAHDRAQFEWYAFSLVAAPDDPVQARAVAIFDQFLDVSEWSDDRIVAHARELGIDVMVDLAGHTQGSRCGALALRCAPAQVTYIGYPGTTAVPAIDYIFGSPVVTPTGSESWFTEQPIRLPWLVPVLPRTVSDRVWTRAEAGLPQDAVVFCSFNNTYKFTPEMFDVWMNILRQVDGSVLWLYAAAPEVETNLRREAQARGIDPVRLYFAGAVDMPNYLARMRLADLFLDTHPYNAHTTALDAVWAGLPVLTFEGGSFVSRMAAGVLSSIGLRELVAADVTDYEARAVALGRDPARLADLRQRLLSPEMRTSPPFDPARFARYLEAAYRAMHERAAAGLPPAPMEVSVDGQVTVLQSPAVC